LYVIEQRPRRERDPSEDVCPAGDLRRRAICFWVNVAEDTSANFTGGSNESWRWEVSPSQSGSSKRCSEPPPPGSSQRNYPQMDADLRRWKTTHGS